VMRCLARDRDRRFATAQDVQRELLTIARSHDIQNSPLVLESYMRELFGSQVDAWRQAFVESSLAMVPTAATVREGPIKRPSSLPKRRRWPFAIAALGVAAALAGVAIVRRYSNDEAAAAVTNAPAPAASNVPAKVAPEPAVAAKADVAP